ncbi:hypothetical protein VPH35_066237 [Triticum aestivum]
MWCFVNIHLICRIACALCHAMPSLNRTCIILGCASCHVHVLVVYYVVCFGVLLGNPVTSCCEDSFDFVRLSSSWTRSSSFPDLRQDDHTLEITSIFASEMLALLLSLCCDTYHLLIMPPILLNQASNPPCPSKPLFGYVTALLSPSYSVVSCM